MLKGLVGLVLGLLLTTIGASSVSAADCQFVLGFKTLRDLVGHDIVGECLENEHHNEFGDTVQQTAGGLLVWRKADNWTAFTDGYRTWINGPIGLEQRLNTERFPWEPDYVPAEDDDTTPPDQDIDADASNIASSTPSLVISTPTVGDRSPMAGRLFTMSVEVRNTDEFSSTPTTLSYFRSTNPTVTTSDTRIGTDFVASLNPSESRSEFIPTYAPSLPGTYYYAACFDSVDGESETANNCSAAIAVTVSAFAMPSLPWVVDGITDKEAKVQEHIHALAQIDAPMAQRLAGALWLADGVSGTELLLLDKLLFLAKIHPATAISVTSVPDGSGHLIATVLKSRERFLDDKPTRLKQLVGQPWFQDGLTGEEAALMVALSETTLPQEVFEDLLSDAHVASDTVTLPLAGDVNLYAVSRSLDRVASALETMGVAVESMERTVGIPWPSPNVIILQELETSLRSSAGGWYAGSHVVVQNTSKHLAYHELAHYYTFSGPKWLVEGMADFLMLHALREGTSAIASDIDAIAQACAPFGSANIHGWNETMAGDANCPYLLGRQFLNRMFRVLGREVVSTALRELYRSWATTSSYASEDEIYQAFLTNTPFSRRGEFRIWYERLHGRPIPD